MITLPNMKRNRLRNSLITVLLTLALSMLRVQTVSSLALMPFFHLERPHPRSMFLSALLQPTAAAAFAFESSDSSARKYGQSTSPSSISNNNIIDVVYQPLSVTVSGVQVPVAAWHPPVKEMDSTTTTSAATSSSSSMQPLDSYQHRISVQKIGKKLAGWTFIPTFVNRNFSLTPGAQNSNIRVVSTKQQLPASTPVVILAHGYLGSRFDLYHLSEKLASEGFLVLSAEYPESLADSFDPEIVDSASGEVRSIIDRDMITNKLLTTLKQTWKVTPTSFGIVGHSLGCGTAERSGDDTWTRVCLAGFPSSRDGANCLFVGSTNDGAVSVERAMSVLRDYNYVNLEEDTIRALSSTQQLSTLKLPSKASLIFTGATAPNHISFLSEETNDAMVDFLSPLLPVARALRIPLLDFDKYAISKDSRACNNVVVPLVVEYLKQKMK